MRPIVTVLQLDTAFPRIAGDVACPESYNCEIEVLCIPKATVGSIVTARPDQIDIRPFMEAIQSARGEIIVTSCGFLSYWQNQLAALTDKIFISSSLIGLQRLSQHHNPLQIMIITFDVDRLNGMDMRGYPQYEKSLVGLPSDMHFRKVICDNALGIDIVQTNFDMAQLIEKYITPDIKHILLECTNLPPYKPAMGAQTEIQITDILTEIETYRAGTVCTDYL